MKFRYENLEVTGFVLVLIDRIYDVTKTLPKEERYELASQMRRASTSILLNLAEGTARKTDPDFRRFITISLGSIVEVHACLKVAVRRSYLTQDRLDTLEALIHRIWRMLCGLRDSQHG